MLMFECSVEETFLSSLERIIEVCCFRKAGYTDSAEWRVGDCLDSANVIFLYNADSVSRVGVATPLSFLSNWDTFGLGRLLSLFDFVDLCKLVRLP